MPKLNLVQIEFLGNELARLGYIPTVELMVDLIRKVEMGEDMGYGSELIKITRKVLTKKTWNQVTKIGK